MPSANRLRITGVLKNQIRLMAGRESQLAAYLYQASDATKWNIDSALTERLEQTLGQRLVATAAMMALPSAAVSLVLLYIMQNESLFTDVLLFCVLTFVLVLCGVLARGIIAGYGATHKLHALTERIVAGDRGRDAIYQKLPELEIVISKTDTTPLARIVCDDVHRYWFHIRGDSVAAKQARASMEKAIIEAIENILSFMQASPSLDSEQLVRRVDSEYVAKLVCKLSSISDDFKASKRPYDTSKKQQCVTGGDSTPTAVKRKLQAT